jgi:hypothetical protein
MNGRIYDPTLGRFLQADPIIQSPYNSQSYNRYSYVFNNPLSYTDPSGFSAWTKFRDKWLKPIVAIAITIYTGGLAAGYGFTWTGVGIAAAGGAAAGYVTTGSLKGALTGAFSAVAFLGVGSYFQGVANANKAVEGLSTLENGLTAAQFVGKIAAHAITGGVMSDLNGGKFGHGFFAAGVTQAVGGQIDGIDAGSSFSVARIVAAAIVGGTVSKVTGGKFANGAVTGAFSRAFNDEIHSGDNQNSKQDSKLSGDTRICQSTCKTLTTSGGGGLAIISAEGGTIYAYDPDTGLVHVFDYAAGGLGIGIGGAASAEFGVLSPTSIDAVSGWGLGVSGFAAAYHGASGQIYGSSYFNDSGTIGGGTGYAFGGGIGVSGILTRTWYRNSVPLSSVPKLEGAF